MRNINTLRSIMVVDDTADIRELMRLQLEMLGYRVLEAADGLEALLLAKHECPDLILMDLMMPNLDGVGATRAIRQTAEICEVPIVAFSARGSGESRERALAAGCNEFIRKLVDMAELTTLLSSYLRAA